MFKHDYIYNRAYQCIAIAALHVSVSLFQQERYKNYKLFSIHQNNYRYGCTGKNLEILSLTINNQMAISIHFNIHYQEYSTPELGMH